MPDFNTRYWSVRSIRRREKQTKRKLQKLHLQLKKARKYSTTRELALSRTATRLHRRWHLALTLRESGKTFAAIGKALGVRPERAFRIHERALVWRNGNGQE